MTLSAADISTDHAAYAARRAETFSRLVPLRRDRRIRLGDLVALEFENVETLRLQVQEMVYVERLTEPGAVAAEVEAYARLLPDPHRLVATMFIEIDELDQVRSTLAELAGLQNSLSLRIGDSTARGVEIPGPDEDPDAPTDTVSVHMVAFPLTDEQRDAFRDPDVPAALVVEHDAYGAETSISGATRLSLLADLSLPA
jgi:hypothetical protein